MVTWLFASTFALSCNLLQLILFELLGFFSPRTLHLNWRAPLCSSASCCRLPRSTRLRVPSNTSRPCCGTGRRALDISLLLVLLVVALPYYHIFLSVRRYCAFLPHSPCPWWL